MALPYPDDAFDAATVGFGARNFGDLPQGLREMVRVVKPGGRVVILEITTPQKPPLSTFFSLWFDRVVPLMGRFDEAYTYLPSSVKRFPGPPPLAGELVAAGCRDVGWILTAGGIIALHHGTVAADGERRGGRRGRRGGGRARPGADARLEERLAAIAQSHGATLGEHAGATIAAGGKRLRPLLVFVAAGPDPAGHDAALRAAVAVELVHSRDARPRRRARRRGAAPRPADGGRGRRAARSRPRPATCCSRARSPSWRAAGRSSRCVCCRTPRPRSSRASCCSARTRGSCRRRASATCAAAISRPRGCSARRASWARWRAAGTSRCWASSASGSGSRSRSSTTCWTSAGPAERTGKHRGTDLLDGTVTLPLILARERDPELARLDLRAVRTPEQAEGVCDAIAATGALEAARRGGAGDGRRGEGGSAGLPEPSQQAALELVADAVVDRYS